MRESVHVLTTTVYYYVYIFLYISMLQYILYVNATIQCMTYSHTCSHALMNVGQIARNMNDIEWRCRFTVALVYQ